MPAPRSFAEIIAPVSEAEFFASYFDQRPLHVTAADRARFAEVISWRILTECLNMTAIWSEVSLGLVLDKVTVPPAQYCRIATDRNNQQRWQPDAAKVKRLLRRGASLVANDIDTLSPGLVAVADALERTLGGKAQSNLYCSWAEHQAFAAHYDTHDVFALHAEGEKRWRIYGNRVDKPIAHEAFKAIPQEVHDRQKGEVIMEPLLHPGDLLYIPRGFYHEALAASPGTVHVAFGLTYVIGLDVINLLLDHAVADPLFRANLPRASAGEDALKEHLAALAGRLGRLAAGDRVAQDVARYRADFFYPRAGFDLPADGLTRRWVVASRGLSIEGSAGREILRGPKGAAPIPPGQAEMVRWILTAGGFTAEEFAQAFPATPVAVRTRLLGDLVKSRVLAED